MNKQITFEEWVSQLQELTGIADGGEGLTVDEIVEATGRGSGWIRKQIGIGIRLGLVKRSRKIMQDIDGDFSPRSSYTFSHAANHPTKENPPPRKSRKKVS